MRVGKARWSPVAGSNAGVMISARKVVNKKVIIGAVSAAEPSKAHRHLWRTPSGPVIANGRWHSAAA